MNGFSAALLFALLLFPSAAFAHSPIPGIGNFYNGILHPLLVPAHLIASILLGLILGRQLPEKFHVALLFFMGAIACGLAVAGLREPLDVATLLLVCAAALGLIVAISPALNRPILFAIAAICGLFIGLDSAPESLSQTNLYLSLVGTFIGSSLAIFYITIGSHRLKKPWQLVGIRIAGSWMAAASLLILALSFVQANQ